MLFAFLFTISSFKIINSQQGTQRDPTKPLIIKNSNFQTRSFTKLDQNNKHKANKFSNALISNSNFKSTGSKQRFLELNIVQFINNTIELEENEKFKESPIALDNGESTIYNLTLKGFCSISKDIPAITFDQCDVKISLLKCETNMKCTLFKGKAKSFSLTDSDISNFEADQGNADSVIYLNNIINSNPETPVEFINNNFANNKIPVFQLGAKIESNFLISQNTFSKNHASSGSCILYTWEPKSKYDYKITIDNNTFTENLNEGQTGLIAGAVKVVAHITIFSGDNYFSKNEVKYEGEEESTPYGAFGASLYLSQLYKDSYTISGLHFESDSSNCAGSFYLRAVDSTSSSDKNMVTISECTFTNSKAETYGGAFFTGYLKSEEEVIYNNDVCFSYCTFTHCQAEKGGAIYIPFGTKDGHESTKIEFCEFNDCTGEQGTAIYCGTILFSLESSIFTNQTQHGLSSDESIIYLFLEEKTTKQPKISNCTFSECSHTVLTVSDESENDVTLEFSECRFESNKILPNADEINHGIIDLSAMGIGLSFNDCNFTSNNGYCIKAETTLYKSAFTNCLFENNEGTQGCAFYIKPSEIKDDDRKIYITITDCEFKENQVKVSGEGRAYGALYIPLDLVEFNGKNTFYGNKAIFEGESANQQNCAIGGSIVFDCTSIESATFSNLHFIESSSTNYGGAFAVYYETKGSAKFTASVSFENCVFTNCSASSGGAIYLDENNNVQYEISIKYCTFDGCKGSPSALDCKASKFEMLHSIFTNLGENNGLFLKVNYNEAGIEALITNCTFDSLEENIHFAPLGKKVDECKYSSVTFNKCKFSNNNLLSNGADSILDLSNFQIVNATFTDCTFKENSGVCIKQAGDTVCHSCISKCTFDGNHGGSGCAIYSEQASDLPQMTIADCTFSNNKASFGYQTRGPVFIHTLGAVFAGVNKFINNECIKDTLDPESVEDSEGGSLFIVQDDPDEYVISNCVFTNSYCGGFGGAILLFCGDYEDGETGEDKKHLFIKIDQCTFTNCSSGTNGGALKCGRQVGDNNMFDNDINITFCTFTNCKSTEGGAVYLMESGEEGDEETVIMYCTFDGCIAPTGSAIYSSSFKFELSHTSFINSLAQESQSDVQSFLHVYMNDAGIEPVVTNCTFENNEQTIVFFVVSPSIEESALNSITFLKCKFIKNNQQTNLHDYVINLEYIQSTNVTFEECLFEENKGTCLFQESQTTPPTYINKCTFNNNYGGRGCAIFSDINEYNPSPYMIVTDCNFSNNKVRSYIEPQGVVYGHTLALEFAGVNYFINNEVKLETEDPDAEDTSAGGSLFITQEEAGEYNLSNLVFINSYSGGSGGAISIHAGDHNEKKQLFITINNCTFTDCSSRSQGGAIKCGKENGEENYDNDVKITNCLFYHCKSNNGGALYFLDGTEKGDEETVITNCTFDGCTGPTGSAITCFSYTLELSNSNFLNSVSVETDEDVQCFMLIILNEDGVSPVISNCTFSNNEQNIVFQTIGTETDPRNNTITFTECKFIKNNQESNQYDSILNMENILGDVVTFNECLFEENNGICIKQMGEVTCNTHIQKCTFNNNKGGSGCAIYAFESEYNPERPYMTISDCIFSNNTASSTDARGIVYCDTTAVTFSGVNQFINNKVVAEHPELEGESRLLGGSLYINQHVPESYKVSNLVFVNSYSAGDGGALLLSAADFEGNGTTGVHLFITLDNCTFTNCTARLQGGAVKCGFDGDWTGNHDNDARFVNCYFKLCGAPEGGALYFKDGTPEGDEETFIEYCTFDECVGFAGSAICCRSYQFEMSHTVFANSTRYEGEALEYDIQSFLFVEMNENVTPNVTNCTFYNNEQNIYFLTGGISIEGSPDTSISFHKCTFYKNNQESNGFDTIMDLQYIQSNNVTFEECIFEDNGGQCLHHVEGPACDTYITKCTFKNNHGGRGCAIYVVDSDYKSVPYVFITDCIFENNKIRTGTEERGVVYCETFAAKFSGTNQFINNEVYGFDEIPASEDQSQGGSLAIVQHKPGEYLLSDLVFTGSRAGGYGGAISLYCGDFTSGEDDDSQKHLFITLQNCKFTNCSSGKQGGALKCGAETFRGPQFTNDVKLINCQFVKCESPEGGALYFLDGDEIGHEETIIEYCEFDGCIGFAGSAISCRSYIFELSYSNFSNSQQYNGTNEDYLVQSFLYVSMNEAGIAPVVSNCTFFNNEQNIEFLVASPSHEGTLANSIMFLYCNFIKNNQESNGADTVFDLQYIQSTNVTFESCTFEENAGHCLKQDSSFACETYIHNCLFNNNHGGSGCAIYAVTTATGVDRKPLMTVADCIFSNNRVTSDWSPRGGAIYGTTVSIAFAGVNRFINNQVVYNNVQRSSPSFYQGGCGGSIYLIQETDKEYELRDAIFSNSQSSDYGGAIAISCFEDEKLYSKLFIDIVGCTFNSCSSSNGGSFCSTIEGTINIDQCQFFDNKASNGGDVYVTDDTVETPSTISISNSLFSNSQAANSGGSLYCKSGSVSVFSNNFTNCQATEKGTAMFIDTKTNAKLENNAIEVNKKEDVSAVYYSSSNSESTLLLEGGCYSTKEAASIFTFETTGKIEFKNEPCFSGSKEEAIKNIGAQISGLDDKYFNCNKCEPIVVPPTPTYSLPSYIPTPPIVPTTAPSNPPPSGEPTSPTSSSSSSSSSSSTSSGEVLPSAEPEQSTSPAVEDKGVKEKKKLPTGALIGIIIAAVVVVVAIVVLIIVLVMRSRTNKNEFKSEQISQEVDKSAYNLESQVSSTDTRDNHPIWAANSVDPGNQGNIDPFMNDFEEATV